MVASQQLSNSTAVNNLKNCATPVAATVAQPTPITNTAYSVVCDRVARFLHKGLTCTTMARIGQNGMQVELGRDYQFKVLVY